MPQGHPFAIILPKDPVTVETGADAILFERLSRALSPQYTLKREIARGGMGVVYLAHDQALNRPVAVKLLMPEHASAALAARFVREAQVLAHLRHPSIVTVHQVSESSGLYFYVMEWLEGETLQDRLTRGPLTRAEVIQLGTDLLDALGAAHQQGWIHRDVKPGNIFLTGERAILTDFGIARPVSDDVTSLTETRQMIGTLAYMSPEQRDGRTVTEASDIYSAGLVLYEAMSGRRWWQRDSEAHDWSGVPSRLKTVLRKAMEPEPADRYHDARRFRKELVGSSRVSTTALLGVLTVLVGVAAVIIVYLWPTPPPPEPDGRVVRLQVLDSRGGGGWGDSIGTAITASLASYADLVVSGPFERRASELNRPGLVLTGSVEAIGDRLRATIQSRSGSSPPINVMRESKASEWLALADSLTAQLIFRIYDRDSSLPGEVLPKTAAGWRAWSLAEPLFTQARWEEAAVAYRKAEALDPTCLLCSIRINDIDRWLDLPHDTSRLARIRAHAGEFPPHYRQLIQAAATRWPERIVLMDSAAQTKNFFLAPFHRGDEIFHRGPLFGRHRSEATADFEQTVNLRPDFMPGWEHLAWLKIAEGDSAGAKRALDKLPPGGSVDQTTAALRLLLRAAFAYRFEASGTGDAIINGALQIPQVADFSALPMAPRLMLTFDAPGAALSMGRIFARRTRIGEIRSGLLAQVFGHLARGQPDSALRYARLLQSRDPSNDANLFAAQLAGALALADPDSSAAGRQRAIDARERLRQFILLGAAGDGFRRRAAWMVVLLAERTGAGGEVPLARNVLGQGTGPTSRYYLKLIEADQLARRGLYDRALGLTDDWSGDDLVRLPDPFFSTSAHFLRSEWQARLGNTGAALSTLLWHEAYDFGTYPVGQALAPEVDLAFGTLARWKQAQMLDQSQAFVSDACRGYRAVERLWVNGNETNRARAELARTRLAALPCDSE